VVVHAGRVVDAADLVAGRNGRRARRDRVKDNPGHRDLVGRKHQPELRQEGPEPIVRPAPEVDEEGRAALAHLGHGGGNRFRGRPVVLDHDLVEEPRRQAGHHEDDPVALTDEAARRVGDAGRHRSDHVRVLEPDEGRVVHRADSTAGVTELRIERRCRC
jgi:hypothetical protein